MLSTTENRSALTGIEQEQKPANPTTFGVLRTFTAFAIQIGRHFQIVRYFKANKRSRNKLEEIFEMHIY